GNTVIVVEHDPTIIAGADQTIELGPGAGEYGGSVLYVGPPRPSEAATAIEEHPSSLSDSFGAITIRGAREHNLKNIDVTIPLGQFVAVTGVSGSGKSTLIRNCLFNRYQRDVRGATGLDVGASTLEGTDRIYDIQFIDQSPIGRSTRSNPATYVKAWDEVRKILSETTAAKLNGVTAGMFSFNTVGGRCDVCEGAGTVTVDMQFLADVEVVCDKCGGKRFNEQVMKVTYKNRNVNDILKMTVDEAMKFFVDKRPLLKKLSALRSVGLGYLRLGQSTASLSGGEAQRLKLASFLSESTKSDSGRLFLFDEPTTGLHHTDVAQLIKTFRNLIDRGNSVLVIEHNIQLIEAANHVIDLGPEGGDGGGELIGVGTPEEIAANPRSIT
ncbi:MAG: ATP-binding cassette domain-containing protein, partial [Thermoanaerobaculia bacterium]